MKFLYDGKINNVDISMFRVVYKSTFYTCFYILNNNPYDYQRMVSNER